MDEGARVAPWGLSTLKVQNEEKYLRPVPNQSTMGLLFILAHARTSAHMRA
jgi:hypothetical protein